MDSLVSSEVGERIDGLLGRKSSRLFVCFCRVLYARKNGKIALIMITIGTWIDSNMMGFFTVVTVRGIVRDSSIYSGLLFDYNVITYYPCYSQTFDVQLAFEFPDNMKLPKKYCDRCCVLPHDKMSFCFVFPTVSDAEIFWIGVLNTKLCLLR